MTLEKESHGRTFERYVTHHILPTTHVLQQAPQVDHYVTSRDRDECAWWEVVLGALEKVRGSSLEREKRWHWVFGCEDL